MSKFYAYDSDNHEFDEYPTLEEAIAGAELTIADYRDACDPEWSMGVSGVYVLEGVRNPDSDENFEGLKPLYRATEVDRQELDAEEQEAHGCEYLCDYRMMPIQ